MGKRCATGGSSGPVEAPPAEGYRPALDGLRGIAVALVVVYHLNDSWMPGGFLGVDAFFVLSGYLITGLLLREYAQSGSISLSRFWTRRVRRLLPAMILMLAAVSAWALLWGDAEDQYDVRRDGMASLLNVANWWFIASDQSYFDNFGSVSLLRHTWSLSIEEQFYLLWPLLLFVLLVLTRAVPKALLLLVASGALASAAAMALLHGPDRSRAYYGTDTRIQELLVGAMLAIALQQGLVRGGSTRWRKSWATVAAAGLVGIVVAATILHDSDAAYYRGGALLFSLTMAAVLAGVEFGGGLAKRVLTARPLVALGVISYGVYLWHWPINFWVPFGWLGIRDSIALFVVKVVVILAVSTASYWLVERPIRRGRAFRVQLTRRRTLVALPLTLAITAGLIFASTPSSALPSWAAIVRPGTFKVMGDVDPKAPTVAILGDSIAKSMLPGLDRAGKSAGVRIVAGTWSGCGVGSGFQLDLDAKTVFPFSDDCDRAVPGAYRELIRRHQPDAIWWHSVRERFPRRTPDGRVLQFQTPAHDAAVLDGYRAAYGALRAGRAPVLISTVVLRGQRYKGQCKKDPTIVGCLADDGADGIYHHMNELSGRFAVSVDGAKMFDLAPIVCPGGAPCPTYVDGVMLRYDGSHITAPGAHIVGPYLLHAILRATGIAPLRPGAISGRLPVATAKKK